MKNLTRLLWVSALLMTVAFAESLDETRKKAESSTALEQWLLGGSYANGKGVPKDSAEAVKWFRKAADQGNASAQGALGVMYAKGDGVPKDLVQAHVWWNIAGASGDADAKTNLVIVEKQMTDTQKKKAMDLARDLFAKIEANKAGK